MVFLGMLFWDVFSKLTLNPIVQGILNLYYENKQNEKSITQEVIDLFDRHYCFLGSALPLYTAISVRPSQIRKKVKKSTQPHLVPGSCTCVCTAFYRIAVIFAIDQHLIWHILNPIKIGGSDQR